MTKKYESNSSLTAVIMLAGLLAAMFYNGYIPYLMSLCWLSLSILILYQFSLRDSLTLRVEMVAIVFFCLLLWIVLAITWHPILYKGIFYAWQFATFFVVLFVTAYLMSERDIKAILYVFLAFAIYLALLSIYQSIILGKYPSGILVSKNNNAACINLFLLPVVSVFLFAKHSKVIKWGLSLVVVLILTALLQTVSRGGILSFFAVAVLMLAFAIKYKRHREAMYVCMMFGVAFVLDALFSPLELKGHLHSFSRWLLFGTTIDMILDSHWYGAGLGMFFYDYPPIRSIEDGSSGHFVHNDYLQILYELGYPGLILLFASIAFTVHRAYHVIKKWDGEFTPIYPGLIAAVAAVSIHSMATFNFYIMGILIVMGFYIGMLMRIPLEGARWSHTYNIAVSKKTWGGIALFTLLCFATIIVPGYPDAMVGGPLDPDFPDRSLEYKYEAYLSLGQFDPLNHRYAINSAEILMLMGKDKPIAERKRIFAECIRLVKQARRLNPYSIGTYAAEAVLWHRYMDVTGDAWKVKSIDLTKKALSMDPRMIRVRRLLASFQEQSGDKADALETLKKGLQQHKHADMYFYNFGLRLSKELGDQEAEKKFRYFIENFPANVPR